MVYENFDDLATELGLVTITRFRISPSGNSKRITLPANRGFDCDRDVEFLGIPGLPPDCCVIRVVPQNDGDKRPGETAVSEPQSMRGNDASTRA